MRFKTHSYIALIFLLSFVSPGKKKITIWMIGDSTMAIKDPKAWPETGWGVPFANFFDSTVVVSNHAKNGRSTRTFMTEGLWEKVISQVQPGDYVFIQFGHNDEVPTKASATKPGEFAANLEKYISESRSKKARPVLFTPVARRKFDSTGKIVGTHDQYAAIVRQVAKQKKVPLVDMDKESQSLLQGLGAEPAKKLFLWFTPGETPNYPQGKTDDTHFSELGARMMAELILPHLKKAVPDLTIRISNTDNAANAHIILVTSDQSVQQAFNSIPSGNTEPVTIYIKSGVYKEKLFLDSSKANIRLVGENRSNTILTWNDHTGKISPAGDTIRTSTSQSFLVAAKNFRAEDITFENSAGPTAGQAVAVQVYGDKAVFKNCRFIGHQDVLFTISANSRQYYEDCYIEGTTDFIFGASTVWFQNCHIHSKKNSFVTAASTPQAHAYGYVFKDCKLTADTAINSVALGRPWRPYSSVTYINCYLDGHILPAGWNNWRNEANEKTARYSEYNSYGPGANAAARVRWSKQLSADEVKKITFKNVFGDWQPD